jgi:hypothetical protein
MIAKSRAINEKLNLEENFFSVILYGANEEKKTLTGTAT